MSSSSTGGGNNNMAASFLSLFRRTPEPGQDENHPLELVATPGLMTLLDVALYRSVEGELTATIAAGHALLCAWLDAKHQAQTLLTHYEGCCPSKAESFARACLEASMDALEKLSTDPLASSANLSDAHEGRSSASSTIVPSAVSDIVPAVADSKSDSGRRRRPLAQRPRDCWETARLLCPDHCWADEAYSLCQRQIRHLTKHSYCTTTSSSSNTMASGGKMHLDGWEREAMTLKLVVQYDLPTRLYQFRTAVEADGVVSKRLYLVKCEYRAPFRAFLEAHQSVYRAPSLDLVDDFIKMQKQPNKLLQERSHAESNLQSLLETPELLEAIALEQESESMEVGMAEAIFPFTEFARILDHKRARLKAIRGVLEVQDVGPLQETVRRLKHLLCRKTGPETTSGIRPLLLDLQGIPRDETPLAKNNAAKNGLDNVLFHLKELIRHLKLVGTLCKTRGAFVTDHKRGDVDLPPGVIKGCTTFDDELFAAQCEDWYNMVERQQQVGADFNSISERIRRAEMEVGISRASEASLGVVRERLELIANDRQKRFEVLKDMIEEVCRREMNLYVQLSPPEKDVTLELPTTSAQGVFGLPLELAGERLPLG